MQNDGGIKTSKKEIFIQKAYFENEEEIKKLQGKQTERQRGNTLADLLSENY